MYIESAPFNGFCTLWIALTYQRNWMGIFSFVCLHCTVCDSVFQIDKIKFVMRLVSALNVD